MPYRPTEVEWWGIIGPMPRATSGGIIVTPHHRNRALDAPTTVGPLRMRPGMKRLVEFHRTDPRALHGTTRHESWPIIVERLSGPTSGGSDAANSGSTLSSQAELHRLACLVSLGWLEPWGVRTAPTPAGALPAVVPGSWPPPPDWHSGESGLLDAVPTSLPEWIVSGWGAIGADPALDRALGAWHQGVLLSPSFPSYALIAFVGAIEAAAKSGIITRAKGEADVVSSGERNDTSQSSEKTGSAQTFWSAVSLVAHPDAVKRLRDDYKLYGRRSSTAHGGRLHGTETTPGAVFLFPVDRNRNDAERSERGESGAQSAQDFELQQLAEARGCATRLMLGAFTGNYDKGDW